MKTVGELINQYKQELNSMYDDSELKQTIQVVFCHYLNMSSSNLLISKNEQLSSEQSKMLLDVLQQLKTNKPLAYILGEWEFYGLTFKVNQHTLIPRQETEELVKLILDENKREVSVLDIGTGSGCIPIALKSNNSLFNVSACDISKEALQVTKQNADLNDADIDIFELDILNNQSAKSKSSYDIIVSNPPYITNNEKVSINDNVLNFEPHLALFVDDSNSLIFYEAISNYAKLNLNKGGKLYFEINENYGNELKELLVLKGFEDVQIVKDINEKDRMVKASIN